MWPRRRLRPCARGRETCDTARVNPSAEEQCVAILVGADVHRVRHVLGSGRAGVVRAGRRLLAGAGVVLTSVLAATAASMLSGCGPASPDDSARDGSRVTADGVRIAGSLRSVRLIGQGGAMPGEFYTPRAIDLDRFGTLWVIDRSGRVQRLDPATGECLQFFKMPRSDHGKPTNMIIAPAPGDAGPAGIDAIWVADTHEHRVVVFRLPDPPATWTPGARTQATGVRFASDAIGATPVEQLAEFGSLGREHGQFTYPCSICVLVGPDGRSVQRVYVGEFGGNDRVQAFDSTLRFAFSFGTFGSGSDAASVEFMRPQSIIHDRTRNALLIADSINHRVGVFATDGTLTRWIGTPDGGDTPGAFSHPRGLLLLSDGSVLVTEFGNGRVQRIDPDTGASLGLWGEPGRAPGLLGDPWQTLLIDGRAVVVEAATNRLTSFDPDLPTSARTPMDRYTAVITRAGGAP
jgi:DNA-binding beta-propeller fold protein YncE